MLKEKNNKKTAKKGLNPTSHFPHPTSNKGITLIALIITIIIMLILVSVTITVAVNGGLFEKAGQAVKETQNAINAEQQLASGDIIEYYLNRKDAVVALKAYSKELLNETGVLTENAKYEDGYSMAVIPKGFKVSDVSSEQTIANGLVIEDESGNQFVWIPVKDGTFERTGWSIDNMTSNEFIAKVNNNEYTDAELRYMVLNQLAISCSDMTIEQYLEFGGSESELLENEGIEDTPEAIKTAAIGFAENNYYGYMSEHTENASNDPTGEYANMVASVAKYGGFYIGRYEAGTDAVRTNTSGTTNLVVQKGAYPYNNVCWGKSMTDYESEYKWTSGSNTYDYGHGAVYLSKNMYTNEEVYGVTSTLCYGVQWDAALRFIRDKVDVTDSANWGNYNNHEFGFTGKYSTDGGTTWSDEVSNETKPVNENYLLTTGASEENKAKNIYDLAGNVAEWTMEANSSGGRVARGSEYCDNGSIFPASYRNIGYRYTFDCSGHLGFRPTLYITNE